MQRALGGWRGTSCPAPQLPGHRDVVLDRSKRWAGRFLARPTRRRMLLRNMAATCRANDPSRKNAVSVYMRRRGGPAGLRPAPAEAFRPGQQHSNYNSNSWFPAGWRGGSGCGGRCKYVHVSSVAPSMALTPPQPDPPHLRQIPAVDRCRPWSTRGSMPCMDEIQSMISKSVGTSIRARRGSTRSRETVRGGAVWAGRTVGAMDGAIEPPWMGLRRVLPAHTAPPSSVARRCCCCFLGLKASAGAGRSPAEAPPLMLRRRMHWAKFPCST